MKSLNSIKNELQLIEDNIGIAINDINTYEVYRKKQDIKPIFQALAAWYENNLPTENVDMKLDIKIQDVYNNDDLTRIHIAFVTASKIFNLYCTDGLA